MQQAVAPKVIPMAIHTPWASVIVQGHELMSKRDIQLLAHALMAPGIWEDRDHGVRVVTFRDDGLPVNGKGEPILANCYPDGGGMIINLQATFRRAEEYAREDGCKSIYACWHQLLFQSYFHEMSHLSDLMDPEQYLAWQKKVKRGPKAMKEDEMICEKFSLDSLYRLAKSTDIEPNHHSESPFLSKALLGLLGEKDDAWSKKQRRMLEDRVYYKLDEEPGSPGLTIDTFKGFCRLLSNEKGDEAEKEWAKPTIGGVGEQSMEQLIHEIGSTITPEEHHVGPATASMGLPSGGVPAVVAQLMSEQGDDIPMADETDNGSWNDWADGNPAPVPPPQVQTAQQPQVQQPVAQAGVPKFCPNCGAQGPFPADAVGCHKCLMKFGTVVGMAPVQEVQTGPAIKPYTPSGLSPENTGAIARAVYTKVFEHMFKACDFASANGFIKPEMVSSPIPLTPEEQLVVVGMDCLDVNGRFCKAAATSEGLRGFIMLNAKLPAYKLYLRDPDGGQRVRLLLPQNPNKLGQDGQPTKTALQARGGTQIMYVMEGNDDVVKAGGKKFYPKCINGVWQV